MLNLNCGPVCLTGQAADKTGNRRASEFFEMIETQRCGLFFPVAQIGLENLGAFEGVDMSFLWHSAAKVSSWRPFDNLSARVVRIIIVATRPARDRLR
jgi:hypothetical protein